MIRQTKGKIFLSDDRGHNEMDWFRSYNTFNFGKYQHEHKTPFGPLSVLNDDTLAGGKSLSMTLEEDFDVLLLPVVGAVSYKDSLGNINIAEAGECQISSLPKGTTIQIANPYKHELVNFLQIWIKRTTAIVDTNPQVQAFDIDNNKNRQVPIESTNTAVKFSIGKYTGREEAVYHIQKSGNALFTFVIEGAFEVQYRLLHARDGLALWETSAIEWEALSNDAIILAIEFPL